MHRMIPFLFLMAAVSGPLAAQLGCGSSVALNADGTGIVVSPGNDDTSSIQCALDEAVQRDIRLVELTAGLFRVGGLHVRGFEGEFRGRTNAQTVVDLLPGGLDCAAQAADGRKPAAFKFEGGRPTVRQITFSGRNMFGTMCTDAGIPRSVLHFTGGAPTTSCDRDFIFAEVDQVVVIDDAVTEPSYEFAIEFAPEQFTGECRDELAGSAKINRTRINGSLFGVLTSMIGAAQLDINFNTFINIHAVNLWIENANQSATVLQNNFILREQVSTSGRQRPVGIYATSPSPGGPDRNRLFVDKNTFAFETPNIPGGRSIAMFIPGTGQTQPVNFNVIVRDNVFDLDSVNEPATTIAQYSTSLGSGSPRFTRPTFDCSALSSNDDSAYHVREIRIDTPGAYEFYSEQAYDGAIFLYRGVFNASNPLANCVAADDDFVFVGNSQFERYLEPGTYQLVTTSWANGDTGSFTNTVSKGAVARFADASPRTGIQLFDISGASITRNRFFGSGFGVGIAETNAPGVANGNVIAANRFGNLEIFGFQVSLSADTSDNIVGPGQDVMVDDQGSNLVLGASPGLLSDEPVGEERMQAPRLPESSKHLELRPQGTFDLKPPPGSIR